MSEKKIYKPIPRLNDHGSSCKGHANHLLDCEYTTGEERDLLIRILENYMVNPERVAVTPSVV